MATLSITKNWADGEILLEADLDEIKTDVETFLNTTKINDDNIQTSGITASSKLIDASISTAKLADSAITAAKIASDAVTTAKILDSNVTTAKIADANVTKAKLATAARDKTTSSKSSDFTADLTKDIYYVNSGSGNVTMTLPAASTADGHEYQVFKTASANTVIIDANSSETINGATTVTLYDQYESITIFCNGSEWFVTARIAPGDFFQPVVVVATRAATLSVADSTHVAMIYSTESIDNKSAYNSSTGTFTVPAGAGGEYLVSASAHIDSNGGVVSWTTHEYVQLAYEINSDGKIVLDRKIAETTSGADRDVAGTKILTLSAGDTLNFYIYQTSSQTIGIHNSTANHLSIVRVR